MKAITFQSVIRTISNIRTHFLPVFVALMVVLAGCTTDAPTDPNSPDTETPESTPSPTPPPEKEQSVDEEVKEAATNIRSKDVPHDAQDHLRSSLTGLYADLPENESERKDEMRDIAAEVCADREAIPYEDIIEGSGDLHEYTYTIGHTSQTMNEQFSAGLNTDRIGSRMSSARGVTAPVSKYAPLVGSYNRFHEAACAFEVGEPGSEEEFYVATAALTMELVLLQYGVFYKASFRATGTAANKLSLMKIYHACGANCYKLTLSQIHWGVRGTLAQASGYAISKSSEIGVELREEDFDQEEVYDTLREQYDDWWESDDELLTHHRERVDKCLEEIQDKGVVDRVWEKVSGISVEDLTAENVTDSVGEIDLEKIPDDKEDEFNDCVYGSE